MQTSSSPIVETAAAIALRDGDAAAFDFLAQTLPTDRVAAIKAAAARAVLRHWEAWALEAVAPRLRLVGSRDGNAA